MTVEVTLALCTICTFSALLVNGAQTSLFLTVVICAGAIFTIFTLARARKSHAYPPGPTGWPIIGNLLQIPTVQPWLGYSAWADTYGDVVHLEALGDHLVVLNSARVAKELLDGRSALYSDRPSLTMAELSGFSVGIALQSYNDEWRAQRRIVAQAFSPGVISRYYPIQELEARKLVYGLHHSPETLVSQTKTRVAAIIMRVTYGYTIQDDSDPMITMPFTSLANFASAAEPGKWIVDFLPQLRYLPPWMPGTSFLRTAKSYYDVEQQARWNPYLWCKGQNDNASLREPCLVANVLSQLEGKLSDDNEATLVRAAISSLGGGLDTNLSAIFTFLLVMLHHPHIQAKAQAEIDTVIGYERLPSITDRPSLPYVRSVIAEVFRCYPSAPIGLPHALRRDDVYKNFLLPKSSIVIPNIWRMLHDPNVYSQPDEFKPERFANDDAEMRKVTDLVFGFGRRACPGSHFAEGTLFAFVTTILATCNVIPKIDDSGKPIIPGMEYTGNVIMFPKHIVCNVQPRTSRARELLEECLSHNQ
ncbi:cytochrome P450 [Daedalea quercina L-15889]|uniref:Cytochrome P450 n=1 Tax=Daedalea quercina L-15889 TaxID=1314783 RepID=A0A165MZ41_9APHY|nr:cytochrome P450 [Daedalea quercina L-15889]